MILFGIYAFVDGVLAIVAAIRGLRSHDRWGAMLFEGIVGLAAGSVALLWPGISAVWLVDLVAAWALITGLLEIAMAVKLRKVLTGEWLLILGGILSIVLAVVCVMLPAAGVVALAWSLGAYALAYGVISLGLAIRVRRWTTGHAHT